MAKGKITGKLWLVAAVVAVMVYQLTAPPQYSLLGGPTSLIIKATGATDMTGTICYLNPSGSSACMNQNPGSNKCQWKQVTGADGTCTFVASFNSSISWPVGVVCPTKLGGKTIYKTIYSVPGSTEVNCGSTTTTTERPTTTTQYRPPTPTIYNPSSTVTTSTATTTTEGGTPNNEGPGASNAGAIVLATLSAGTVLYIGKKK